MYAQHYREMIENLNAVIKAIPLSEKSIFLFGHCNASEELVDVLLDKRYSISGVLDNNTAKQGNNYRGVKIISPDEIMRADTENAVVFIVARAYAAMTKQLDEMGFKGIVRKLIDYNSFADYSLSEDTISRMQNRLLRGKALLDSYNEQYGELFKIFCPFSALGDVYIMMSFLPHFLKKRQKMSCVVFVVGQACAQVVKLFGDYEVRILSQKDMDETLQAVIYSEDENSFIAHQDRPYVINLHKALYVKCIPLEIMYCCGVFGLPKETVPVEPQIFTVPSDLALIPKGKSVILSPYAKSVVSLPDYVWQQIIKSCTSKGYKCFTNVVGDEVALAGTTPISPSIAEIKSVVEHAGTFIGIRSGLCDVIRCANAKKIALYPDYNYSDTQWKAIEMYSLIGWDNIEVKDEFQWTI